MSRRSGLGRGLAALIPPPSEPTPRDRDGAPGQPDAATPPSGENDPATEQPPTSANPVESVPSETPRSAAGPRPGDGDDSGRGPDEGGPSATGAAAQVDQPAGTLLVLEVNPARIGANPRQPREVFDPDELEGLATSLLDVGMLQPLVVRPLGDERFELVAGERRLRAARLAGLDTVPVLVRHTEDADLLKEALVENIHRVQLNPLEEGAAYQQLLDEFDVTQEELARRLGRSRPAIANSIRILQLPPAVQRRVAAGVLSAGHAKALLALADPAAQVRLAERIVAEGLSVRATEELVRLRAIDERRPRSRRPPLAVPGLQDLQDDLSDALQARVRITMGAKRGKLSVEFASVDDLERIVAVIADGLGAGGTQVAASGGLASPRVADDDPDAPDV